MRPDPGMGHHKLQYAVALCQLFPPALQGSIWGVRTRRSMTQGWFLDLAAVMLNFICWFTHSLPIILTKMSCLCAQLLLHIWLFLQT